MLDTVIIVLALTVLFGLLFFEKKESTRGIIMTKPLLSSLFVLAALSTPHANQQYFGLVLAERPASLSGLPLYYAGQFMIAYSIGFF
jgi:hypothetical protein